MVLGPKGHIISVSISRLHRWSLDIEAAVGKLKKLHILCTATNNVFKRNGLAMDLSRTAMETSESGLIMTCL